MNPGEATVAQVARPPPAAPRQPTVWGAPYHRRRPTAAWGATTLVTSTGSAARAAMRAPTARRHRTVGAERHRRRPRPAARAALMAMAAKGPWEARPVVPTRGAQRLRMALSAPRHGRQPTAARAAAPAIIADPAARGAERTQPAPRR